MLLNKAEIVEKLIRTCLITCFKIRYVIGYVYEFMVNKGTYFFKMVGFREGAFPYETCRVAPRGQKLSRK